MAEAKKLTEKQIDALKEVGSIGSGHAAIALSQLLGKRISIAVTRVEVVPSDEFNLFVGGPDTPVATIYLQILGDMRGGIILIFKREDALKLADILMQREKGHTRILTEMDQSAIKEAGNIITGSYLSAMSLLISFKIALSVPRFAFDVVKEVMEGVFAEIMQPEKKGLSLVTEFIESSFQIKGYYIFIPRKESLEKILKGLKV